LPAYESAARDLDDHRRLDLLRGGDDALDLLHVVGVERSDAVAALGGLVEHLAQRGKRHPETPLGRRAET